MSTRIAFDSDAARQHARRLTATSDDLAEASAAAYSTHLGDGAFGLMCSFLVAPARAICTAATDSIDALAVVTERASRQVAGLARDFEELEYDLLDGIRALETRLDGLR